MNPSQFNCPGRPVSYI